jgi:hypothetical protein
MLSEAAERVKASLPDPSKTGAPCKWALLGRALGTSVADRFQHPQNFGRGCVWRDPWRGLLACDGIGSFLGMRIGTISHPAVIFALSNGMRSGQYFKGLSRKER